jgi:hypothetical protein
MTTRSDKEVWWAPNLARRVSHTADSGEAIPPAMQVLITDTATRLLPPRALLRIGKTDVRVTDRSASEVVPSRAATSLSISGCYAAAGLGARPATPARCSF